MMRHQTIQSRRIQSQKALKEESDFVVNDLMNIETLSDLQIGRFLRANGFDVEPLFVGTDKITQTQRSKKNETYIVIHITLPKRVKKDVAASGDLFQKLSELSEQVSGIATVVSLYFREAEFFGERMKQLDKSAKLVRDHD